MTLFGSLNLLIACFVLMAGTAIWEQARHSGVRFLRAVDPGRMDVTAAGQGLVLTLEEATLPGTRLTLNCRRLVIPGHIRPSAWTPASRCWPPGPPSRAGCPGS